MAIDTTVTLKRQIVEFNEWATAHPMVNDFGYGQYLEVYKQSGNKYLTLVVNSPTLTSEDFFVNYSWEVICLDYVLDQKDNMQRVLSDTQDVLRDLENTIRYSKRWKEFSRADGNWSYRKVDEFGADKCFGWIATFILKIKKKHGICDISSLMPTYDFETGSIVYPTCDPVLFAINGTDEDSFASGSTFNMLLVNQDGDIPAYSFDEVLGKLTVQTGGGSIDIAVNGTPFYSGVSTNQDLPVKKSDGTTNTGSKVGANWQVGDVTQTLNGAAITNNKAETSKAITIRYANNDPVTVTTIADTETVFIGEVPDVVVPLNTSNPFKTGQTTSYVANDDGDLERGNGVDFTTLSHNNYFGNTDRFTDILGGQTYTSGWIIDWSTWNQVTGSFLMWYKTAQTGATWTNAMAGQPYNVGGFADCYLPNATEIGQLYNFGLASALNYAPFNYTVVGTASNLWTSTTVPSATTTAIAFQGLVVEAARAKTLVIAFFVMRYGNISEL